MARLSEDRWALVRRLYEESTFTVAEIAIFADVAESSVYQHARRGEWTSGRRPGIVPRKVKARNVPPTPALVALSGRQGEGGREPDEGQADRPEVDRAEVARRLWAALDRHLDDLETLEAPHGVLRTAQNLSTLARTLVTLVDVERDLARDRQPAPQSSESEDVEDVLLELARRIEAMP